MKKISTLITIPRIIVVLIILSLLLQIQKGKSHELPKYASAEFVAESILERVNEHRVSIKETPLTTEEALNTEAQRYCEMIAKGNLQAGLCSDATSPLPIAEEVVGWDTSRGMARNIMILSADKNSPALSVIRHWINQQSDIQNIENENFIKTGIGVVRRGNTYFVCQLFSSGV